MIGTSPHIGSAGYLAAFLAVWCLLIAGGMSTHVPRADDHVHLPGVSEEPLDAHAHLGHEKKRDICSGLLHCGADLLALSAEPAIAVSPAVAEREGDRDRGPAKRVYVIEPPPPRFVS